MEENVTQFWGDCVSKVCPGIKQSMMLSLAKFPLTILWRLLTTSKFISKYLNNWIKFTKFAKLNFVKLVTCKLQNFGSWRYVVNLINALSSFNHRVHLTRNLASLILFESNITIIRCHKIDHSLNDPDINIVWKMANNLFGSKLSGTGTQG